VAGISKGEPWGRPHAGPADVEVAGDDADLALGLATHAGGLVAWVPRPEADLARALGLRPGARIGPPTWALPLDLLRVAGPDSRVAANAVVLGAGPGGARFLDRWVTLRVTVDDRTVVEGRQAIGVVVANGPFLAGARASLRAHPGDGRLDVLVLALARGQRREMRRRLATASHVPHPDLVTATGRRVVVESDRALPLTIDGRVAGMAARLEVVVHPAVANVLVGPPGSRPDGGSPGDAAPSA
jgi:hypothetical protein